ncbi:MAG: hypothetical protein HW416_3130, partial [Chloroflexi bacterium]|nr:hypothetical protein [Chloroflexota bacterium]
MYICLVHADRMYGCVDVAPSTATDTQTQTAIDAQANAEMGVMMK